MSKVGHRVRVRGRVRLITLKLIKMRCTWDCWKDFSPTEWSIGGTCWSSRCY